MANIVAIVGRPNVGKSTFFNRLVEERKAIEDNVSGVTRDRHYGHAQWGGKYFSVIDTGGYVIGSDDVFESEIRKQVTLALEEANVILFVVDCHDGLTDLDKEFDGGSGKTVLQEFDGGSGEYALTWTRNSTAEAAKLSCRNSTTEAANRH